MFSPLDNPDKIIESAISKLYFHGNKVYKIYNQEKYFFGDFSNDKYRNNFYKEDFSWNHTLSPDIYLKLGNTRTDNYILMKKINPDKSLMNLLIKKSAAQAKLIEFVKTMTQRINILTKLKKQGLKKVFGLGLAGLLREDIRDLYPWCHMAAPALPKGISNRLISRLEKVAQSEKYFKNFPVRNLSLSIDNHSGNIVLVNGKFMPIDVMPPKLNWRVCDPYANISRPAVDAMVLQSEKLGQSMYRAYETMARAIPGQVKTIYELRSALIMLPYMYMLKKPRLGQKYLKFIRHSFAKIK